MKIVSLIMTSTYNQQSVNGFGSNKYLYGHFESRITNFEFIELIEHLSP